MEHPITFWDKVKRVAADLDIKKCTITKWRQRGAVPAKWRIPIHQRSAELGLDIQLNDFFTEAR